MVRPLLVCHADLLSFEWVSTYGRLLDFKDVRSASPLRASDGDEFRESRDMACRPRRSNPSGAHCEFCATAQHPSGAAHAQSLARGHCVKRLAFNTTGISSRKLFSSTACASLARMTALTVSADALHHADIRGPHDVDDRRHHVMVVSIGVRNGIGIHVAPN